MTTPQQHLEQMAYAFDNNYDDSDGELDYMEISDVVLEQLHQAGLLTRCSVHGLYATFRGLCPPCHYCSDCEESPCVCDDSDACEECGYVDCECERCHHCASLIEDCTCVKAAS